MEEALSRISSLALSDRKKLHERHTCTPVLFDYPKEELSAQDRSLVWETLAYISSMISQRILDSILLQLQAATLFGSPKSVIPVMTELKDKMKTLDDANRRSPDVEILDHQETEMLLSTRKSIEQYSGHIAHHISRINDIQRELMFTRTELILLCMRKKNALHMDAILSNQTLIRSLRRLQTAFEEYEVTLQPPSDFRCEIDHEDVMCECYKDFDDYGDFSGVTECLDGILDAYSDSDQSDLPGIAAVSIFYLRLAPQLDTEAVEDAREEFVTGKDFLLSIWERLVTKLSCRLAPLDLFYMFFLLESLNSLEGHKGFQNCIQILKKQIWERKVDVCSIEKLLSKSEKESIV